VKGAVMGRLKVRKRLHDALAAVALLEDGVGVLAEVFHQLVVHMSLERGQASLYALRKARHGGERVVHLMGHAGGQHAHGGDLLRLVEFRLVFLLQRHVPLEDQHAVLGQVGVL